MVVRQVGRAGQDDPGLLNFGSIKESHRFKAAIGYPLRIAPSIQFSVFEGVVLMNICEQVVLV